MTNGSNRNNNKNWLQVLSVISGMLGLLIAVPVAFFSLLWLNVSVETILGQIHVGKVDRGEVWNTILSVFVAALPGCIVLSMLPASLYRNTCIRKLACFFGGIMLLMFLFGFSTLLFSGELFKGAHWEGDVMGITGRSVAEAFALFITICSLIYLPFLSFKIGKATKKIRQLQT